MAALSKLEVAHRRDLHLADDLELRVAVLDLELHVEHADRVLETGQFIGITRPHNLRPRSRMPSKPVCIVSERTALQLLRESARVSRTSRLFSQTERT